MREIQDLLRALGVTRTYKGYTRLLSAVSLALEDESRLEEIKHEIYERVAAISGCEWTTVERSIRTAVLRAWEKNRTLLMSIAGYPLDAPPTASEFVEMLVMYVRHHALAGEK